MNYYSDMGQFGSTLAIGNQSRQFSATATGSLVAHRGGLTMGPALGESPFAIVNVPGAEGAKLLNGYGSRIDSRGYAIVPSLTPYRENTVSVDSKGLPDTVDILQNEQVIIPRMGAAVSVTMKTQSGQPVLLIIRDPQGNYLPIGSELTNASGEVTGIVGQAGMAFIRGWNIGTEAISVRTGSTFCTISADNALAQDISRSGSSSVIRAEVICKS
ncbi:fimbria/pilus outer membrane usher protein [Tatumella ptyseos]|uniref:Heat shock protein E n=2 Tax=Tatumella ptyseos TaxID=82987 RepID=A0A2X5NH55_9GAMM|nr:fimbria/pilus outer membrane usher protein [Tatumella ptyseos]SQK72838.1 Heat shock protein E [Tatumella ptyseos]